MPQVPDGFRKEFWEKGDTFFEIAELLYNHPDRLYTQDELARRVDRSNATVSNHLSLMEEEGWLDRRENQTTFSWNREAHNPASTEGTTAVRNFYVDFWHLVRKHSETVPGTFAVLGFAFILAAIVIFAFFIGFSLGVTEGSVVPAPVYLAIAAGSFITGVIVTFLSPLQAIVNRFIWRRIPKNPLRKK